ncbi:PilZ domain-containing protein [Candidatus Omnitrophota bacterium]
MRAADYSEKRQFKRLDLSFPTTLKNFTGDGEHREQEGVTLNVSYNGAYVADIEIKNIKVQDTLKISISVPREETRDFPFSRVVGKAKVIRVDKDGVALEFTEDVNRLFVAN